MNYFFFITIQLGVLLSFVGCQNHNGYADFGSPNKIEVPVTPEPDIEQDPVFLNTPSFAKVDVKSNDNYVKIKSGRFQMGSPESEIDRSENEILHTVVLTSDFEMQKTVVTQAQYFLVMKKNPGYANRFVCPSDYLEIKSARICPHFPVTGVSWVDAQEFIKKLNLLDSNFNYQLPTEAEWEYSTRAGSRAAYWFGDDVDQLDKYVCLVENKYTTRAVGVKQPNPWGLYDMIGNTHQWILDGYAPYEGNLQRDPVGKNNISKSLRGDTCGDSANFLRSASRSGFYYENRTGNVSFRLTRRPQYFKH